MPQSQYNMTGRGIGQTVGRYGLGAFGGMVGGLPGAWIGSKIGGPLGGLVGAGLSSLFGPHGLGAIGNPGQSSGAALPGIGMLTGRLAGSQPSGSGVTASAGGGLIMNNRTYNSYRPAFGQTYQQLANPGSAIGPLSGATSPDSGNIIRPAPMGQGVTGYGAQAMAEVRKRNIL